MIDVTDVNDNIPQILLTEVNGTKHDAQPISLPECTPTGKRTQAWIVVVATEAMQRAQRLHRSRHPFGVNEMTLMNVRHASNSRLDTMIIGHLCSIEH